MGGDGSRWPCGHLYPRHSRHLPLPSTLRSYDLGATWHYMRMEDLKRPLATDDDGNLIGADPDKPAVAIYTLPTATPRPSATPSR